MSRLIKIIDADTIELADYRCGSILYPETPLTLQNIKDQMDHCEDWCVFKETINPFQMYADNNKLNNIINKLDKLIEQYSNNEYYYKYNGKYLKSEIIKDLKELKEGK